VRPGCSLARLIITFSTPDKRAIDDEDPVDEGVYARFPKRGSLVNDSDANLLFDAEAGSFDSFSNPCFR
jgi:hypothetical protein